MNENINLCKILQYCPKGTKLYSPVIGEVIFEGVDYNSNYPIKVSNSVDGLELTKYGHYLNEPDTECLLFPSKDQRDWSKFRAPWLKKPKFDPKTLQPFNKILVRETNNYTWFCDLLSHIKDNKCYTISYCQFDQVVPYNEDTKHLVGTKEEAPEYYRYWED